MTWALSQKLKAPDKLVLLLLGYRTNPDTEVADATLDKLATECGMSRSGVKVVIQRLVDAGLVEVEIRKVEGGKNLPNLYRLTFVDRGHDVTPGGSGAGPNRGHDVTTRAGSNSEGSSTPRAKLDFSTWPTEPSAKHLDGWLKLRRQKRAPVTEIVMEAMGKALHEAKAIGWDVDDVLEECCNRGWQGFRVGWLEPRNGKPQPVRAGAGTASPPHGRQDYARGGQGSNNGARGGAIDRVLGNARARAEEAAPADGAGSDRGDDDGSVRAPLDFDPR